MTNLWHRKKRKYLLSLIWGVLLVAPHFGYANTAALTTDSLNNLEQSDSHQASAMTENNNDSHLLANSRIQKLSTQQSLTPDEFVAQLASQDYVILGEYHDSIAQHQLASWLLDSLYQQRKQGSLLLEMLKVDQQPLIDELAVQIAQNPQLKLTPDQLKHKLDWQESWDWQLYQEVVTHPLLHDYDLVATNLTKNEVSILMQGAAPIKGYDSTTPKIKSVIKNKILQNHNMQEITDEKDRQVINNMVEIQQFRDRRMAEKLLLSASPSLLLVGNFHAYKSIGVPVHLADLQSVNNHKKQGVVVLMVSDTQDISQVDADYLWIIKDK